MSMEKAAKSCKPSRIVLLENPVELAIAFAKVVTQESDNTEDWVARNGDRSIFSALRLVLPEVK